MRRVAALVGRPYDTTLERRVDGAVGALLEHMWTQKDGKRPIGECLYPLMKPFSKPLKILGVERAR